ncbi:MAG: hypothetical protein AAF492_28705, partial [Verrucomicrobiota bacterium]
TGLADAYDTAKDMDESFNLEPLVYNVEPSPRTQYNLMVNQLEQAVRHDFNNRQAFFREVLLSRILFDVDLLSRIHTAMKSEAQQKPEELQVDGQTLQLMGSWSAVQNAYYREQKRNFYRALLPYNAALVGVNRKTDDLKGQIRNNKLDVRSMIQRWWTLASDGNKSYYLPVIDKMDNRNLYANLSEGASLVALSRCSRNRTGDYFLDLFSWHLVGQPANAAMKYYPRAVLMDIKSILNKNDLLEIFNGRMVMEARMYADDRNLNQPAVNWNGAQGNERALRSDPRPVDYGYWITVPKDFIQRHSWSGIYKSEFYQVEGRTIEDVIQTDVPLNPGN